MTIDTLVGEQKNVCPKCGQSFLHDPLNILTKEDITETERINRDLPLPVMKINKIYKKRYDCPCGEKYVLKWDTRIKE